MVAKLVGSGMEWGNTSNPKLLKVNSDRSICGASVTNKIFFTWRDCKADAVKIAFSSVVREQFSSSSADSGIPKALSSLTISAPSPEPLAKISGARWLCHNFAATSTLEGLNRYPRPKTTIASAFLPGSSGRNATSPLFANVIVSGKVAIK